MNSFTVGVGGEQLSSVSVDVNVMYVRLFVKKICVYNLRILIFVNQ